MPTSVLAPATPRTRDATRSRRLTAGIALAVALLVVAVLLSLAVGNKSLSPAQVVDALAHPGSDYADLVVASRIPRTILGLLVGGALSVAGVLVQGITRNPLGDPSILGVNLGAAAAIVTALAFFGAGGAATSVWVALPGAAAAVVVAYVLGSSRRSPSPVRLILAGAVVSAVLAAYIQGITLSFPAVFDTYRFWVIGSLAGRDPALILDILPFIVAGLALAFALGPALNVLALGEDTATALGAHTGRTRALGILSATLLCAAATAGAGPIAFLGLAVPHIVRRTLTGDDHRWLVPFSLVLGSVLLLVSDVVGRLVVRPDELMAGVVTAFLGGPVLLLAVRRLRTTE